MTIDDRGVEQSADPVIPAPRPGGSGREPRREALRHEVERLRKDLAQAHRDIAAAQTRATRAEEMASRLRRSRAIRLAALRHSVRRMKLLSLIREAWRIVRDRPSTDEALATAAAPQISRNAAIRQSLHSKDYDRALALIARATAGHARDPEFLRLKRDTHYRRGELSEAFDASQQLARLNSSVEHRTQVRFMAGRALETDALWLPRIPGPARPVEPRSENSVLLLLKESLPYHNNGFCMRSHYSMMAMRAAGLEPAVITSPGFPRRDGITDFPELEVIDGIPHHRIELGYRAPASVPFDDYLRDYAWAAARLARTIRPAVLHVGSGYRGYEPALVGIALRAHLKLPLVYEVRSFFETTWTGDVDRSELGEHYARRFATENRCMRTADAVITIAGAMQQEIIERGVAPERVFVIPNGVDADIFVPRHRDRQLARSYGVDGIPTFGYVSNLDHVRENQETLIGAMRSLRARGSRARCLIIGDGRRRGELETLAKTVGVADEVIFTGKVPHERIQDYYALLDVFVVPRMSERAARLVTPLKPYEAMAMALPCVVSELPALLEIIGGEERGLSFPPEDATALADRLQRLFDDAPLRERLGHQGRSWVLNERSWKANGPRYADVYHYALDRWTSAGETRWK